MSGTGPLQPGDILVSNFNNSSNLQGTGTTIVRITANGSFSTFFTTPNATLGGSATGLSTALAILKKGFVIVGSVPSSDGSIATSSPGSLLVIDNKGNLLSMITDPTINGPWDMTVEDQGDNVTAFVSNVFAGTVVRLDLHLAPHGVTVTKKTVIASGYQHRGDPVAFAVGPTGLVFDQAHDTLFVASTEDNAVYAVQNAEKATTSQGTGSIVYTDATHLHGPLGMATAPNGHLLVANSDVINSDPNQPSEIVEFTLNGQFVTQLSVDPSQGGSFGLAVNVKGNIATFAAVDDNTASLLIWTLAVSH
jgi:sugar lactone lactonase YvrE